MTDDFAIDELRHPYLVISASVIAFLIITSILGVVGIGLAIVFHEGSTLVVVANSLRLLAYRE